MLLIEETPTVPWSAFTPEVLVSVGEAPDDMVENYVRQAAIALAVRSQVLVRDIELRLQNGVQEYLLSVPPHERIESIQRVGTERGCGTRVGRGESLYMDGLRFTWPDRLQVDADPTCHPPLGRSWAHGPVGFHCAPPTPAPTRSVWVRAAVAPTRDSCEVDAVMYERYHEAVINGALARLFLVKKAPWYDPALAAQHRTRAGEDTVAAGLDRLTGGLRGPFKMKPRRVV